LFKGEKKRGKNNVTRCPYCVEGAEFKTIARQSAGDWFMCARCGHLALPSSSLFKCTCTKCQRLGLNLDEQKRTFGQEIEKRLRYLFKLLYMSIYASFLLGILGARRKTVRIGQRRRI
jgi:hypothetical protein